MTRVEPISREEYLQQLIGGIAETEALTQRLLEEDPLIFSPERMRQQLERARVARLSESAHTSPTQESLRANALGRLAQRVWVLSGFNRISRG